MIIDVTDAGASYQSGRTYVVVLNGVRYEFTTVDDNRDATQNLNEFTQVERSSSTIMNLVAQRFAQFIAQSSPVYTASSSGTKITISDQSVLLANGQGFDTFTFTALSGGDVRAVFDIDNSTLIHEFLPFLPFGITVSHTLELLDAGGNVLAANWYKIGQNPDPTYTLWASHNARTDFIGGGIAGADQGSKVYVDTATPQVYDPFLEYVFSSSGTYYIRVSSVITYTDVYSDQVLAQFRFADFIPNGMSYELNVSLQGHDSNQSAIDLVNRTLTIVEGTGAGQSATITGYDALNQDYALAPIGAWAVTPDSTSRYDITGRLSQDSSTLFDSNAATTTAAGSYNSGLGLAQLFSANPSLVVDGWSVVLTKQPAAGTDVIVNVVPTATRTYNADEAFNPDAAFGENTAEQVRVATDRGADPAAAARRRPASTGSSR